MPKVEGMIKGFDETAAEVSTALQSLRSEIHKLKVFCLNETMSHYSKISGAMLPSEIEYVRTMNPFVPRSE